MMVKRVKSGGAGIDNIGLIRMMIGENVTTVIGGIGKRKRKRNAITVIGMRRIMRSIGLEGSIIIMDIGIGRGGEIGMRCIRWWSRIMSHDNVFLMSEI